MSRSLLQSGAPVVPLQLHGDNPRDNWPKPSDRHPLTAIPPKPMSLAQPWQHTTRQIPVAHAGIPRQLLDGHPFTDGLQDADGGHVLDGPIVPTTIRQGSSGEADPNQIYDASSGARHLEEGTPTNSRRKQLVVF